MIYELNHIVKDSGKLAFASLSLSGFIIALFAIFDLAVFAGSTMTRLTAGIYFGFFFLKRLANPQYSISHVFAVFAVQRMIIAASSYIMGTNPPQLSYYLMLSACDLISCLLGFYMAYFLRKHNTPEVYR